MCAEGRPAPCKVDPAFSAAETFPPGGGGGIREPPDKKPAEEMELGRAWSPETTRVQLEHSTPKLGAGVSVFKSTAGRTKGRADESTESLG